MVNKLKKEKGITLIALVITIIVLLILAGVSIAMLTGENGILTVAQRVKEEMDKKASEEQIKLSQLCNYINSYIGEEVDFNYLNIKGLYKLEETEEKILIDCIREIEGKFYREQLEINSNDIKVLNSINVKNLEDLAIPLYLMLVEEDTSKIEYLEEFGNYIFVSYNNTEYQITMRYSEESQITSIDKVAKLSEKNWIDIGEMYDVGEYPNVHMILQDDAKEIYILKGYGDGKNRIEDGKLIKLNIGIEWKIKGNNLIYSDNKTIGVFDENVELITMKPKDKMIKDMKSYIILYEDGEVYNFDQQKTVLENVKEIYESLYIYKDNNDNILLKKDNGKFENLGKIKTKKIINSTILTEEGDLLIDGNKKEIGFKIKDFLYGIDYKIISQSGEIYTTDWYSEIEKMELGENKFKGFIQNLLIDEEENVWIDFTKIYKLPNNIKKVISTNKGLMVLTEENKIYTEGYSMSWVPQ